MKPADLILKSCIAVLMTALSASAFGNDETWVSGWGQGTKEALIKKGPGNQIYVACQEGSSSPSSISFMLAGDSTKDDRVFLTFDSKDPEAIWVSNGEITSDCRACASNFDYVIERLKSHSSVHVQFTNGDATRFSLAGSTKAIGVCTASFYQ
jgi:hypothetical protein